MKGERRISEFDRPLDRQLPFTRLPDGDVYAPEVGFSGGFPVARDPQSGRMWLVHGYGMVGSGRDNAADSGGGTELFAVIRHAPRHLDRNDTLIGRIVQEEFFDATSVSIPHHPPQPKTMKQARLSSRQGRHLIPSSPWPVSFVDRALFHA